MPLSPVPRNPFVYGRVLTAADAACPRPELEARVKQTLRDDARLALVGDRRMGKSSLVERTLEIARVPLLRLNYHEVLDLPDVLIRTTEPFERFLRERSPIARKLVPWMREIGLEMRELRSDFAGVGVRASLGVPSDHLKRVFGFIRDCGTRAPFALFIDELQDLRDRLPGPVGNAVLAVMRDEIQHMSKSPVFFAGSARESFSLLFTSDASPLYEHAPLVAVPPIPQKEMLAFIKEQFSRGRGIGRDAAELILRIAGDSPNDVQRLGHEAWNEHLASLEAASAETVQRALVKVLRDLTPYGEKWLADLSPRQQRVVFAVAFLEHLGASTNEFLAFAGLRNPGDTEKALAPTLGGAEALLEKVRSRYRFRSRFVRLWFALRFQRVEAVIPAMRAEETYRNRLAGVLPPLPVDPFRLL